MSNLFYRWEDIQKLRRGEIVKPTFVDFHTSNVCNHNCQGCAYGGKLTTDIMPEDRHKAAVKIFLEQGVKAFDFAGGGDPCFLPYLPKLVELIADNGAHSGIITNGSHISEQLRDAVLAHSTYIRISLEASNQDAYSNYKHVPSIMWDRVIGNINSLVSLKKKSKSDCEITIKFSVSKSLRGEKHYCDALRLAIDLGVDRVSFKALRHQPEELTELDKYREDEFLADISAACKSCPPITRWIVPVRLNQVPQCWLNPLHTVMDWQGNIYICCYYYYRDNDFKIGNIFEQKFDDIWFGEVHRQKLKKINRKHCAMVDCKFFRHHRDVENAEKRGAVYFM